MPAGLLSFSAPPAHNGGLAQINMWSNAPTAEVWALNMCKQALRPWVAYNSSGSQLGSGSDWPSRINSNGYPTSMPSEVSSTWRTQQLWIYGQVGTVWVLDWPGQTASMTLANAGTGGSLTESTISATRKEYTIASGPPVTNAADGTALPVFLVQITLSSFSGTLDNIRLYNKDYESLINGSGATSIFDPNFLTRVKQFGAIRFMDWHDCNYTRHYRWADRRSLNDFNWCGEAVRGSYFYGTATQSLNKQTISTLPTLTNGLPVQFFMPARPINKVITATTTGNPTRFTIAGHGLTTGDKVGQDGDANGGGSWSTTMSAKSTSTGLPPEYTVTVVDADTIEIDLNSTGFTAPSGTFRIIPQIQISDGTVTKRCLRKGLTNYFNSEWAAYASGGMVTAVYDSLFDVFVMSGNGSGNVYQLGVPYEVMISLANYARAHPWFTINYMADDDHWTQLATLCKSPTSGLRAGLTPYFEPGNEIWNPGTNFWQTEYARSKSVKSYGATALTVDLGYSGRLAQVSGLIAAVYGNGSDWKMVMAVQAVSSVSTNRFQGNSTINGGSSAGWPLNKSDVIAFGPYIYTAFTFSGSAASYTGFAAAVDNYNTGNTTAAFNFLLNELTTQSNPSFGGGINPQQDLDGYINVQTPRWVNVTTGGTYTGRTGTLKCSHYEGGNGIAGPDSIDGGFPTTVSGRNVTVADVRNFLFAFLESSQAATFMTNYLTRSAAAGVVFPSYYTVAGSWSFSATWGAQRFNSYYGSATPQYTALLDWN